MATRSTSNTLPTFDPNLDHFSRLGLCVGYNLDRGALEELYLQLSSQVHPDRFVMADSSIKRASMEHSASINEAYKTLRDKVLRAEYLVKLGGIDLDSSDASGGAPAPTQIFLIEMLEIRDELDDKVREGEDAVEEMRDEVDDRAKATLKQAVVAIEAGQIPEAAKAMVEHRYLQRLIGEISQAIEE